MAVPARGGDSGNATIWENNIVQTVASAAGTLSSIIFVLPGLVMVGWWTGFPFWQSFGICVDRRNPRRDVQRAVAARDGHRQRSAVSRGRRGRRGAQVGAERRETRTRPRSRRTKPASLAIVWGSIVSAASRVVGDAALRQRDRRATCRVRRAIATGNDIGLSLALLGVGHLVGITVGIAMLVGIVIAWGVLVPVLTALHPTAGDGADRGHRVWPPSGAFHRCRRRSASRRSGRSASSRVPSSRGVLSLARDAHAQLAGEGDALPITERDIPINLGGIVS
jgi:hypothetical protein